MGSRGGGPQDEEEGMKNTQLIKLSEVQDSFEDREKRMGQRSETHSCILCGRKANKHFVAMTTACNLIPMALAKTLDVDDPTPDGASGQGCFPIGPECRRKIPAEFVATAKELGF